MIDVLDHYPYTDEHTAELITTAIGILADRRGLHHQPDPAIRLHLLASLYHQTRYQLLEAILDAHDHGYNTTEIAILTQT